MNYFIRLTPFITIKKKIVTHHHNINTTKEKEDIFLKIPGKDEVFLKIPEKDEVFLKIPEEDEKICCICLEKIETKKIIMSDCKHEMHVKCARKWFNESPNCPFCRSDQIRLKKRICWE